MKQCGKNYNRRTCSALKSGVLTIKLEILQQRHTFEDPFIQQDIRAFVEIQGAVIDNGSSLVDLGSCCVRPHTHTVD
ncbi:hypothetical protein HOLleu_40156 [Holothuria leucospilota]|uniref:Uncharacterized protein n=1 Tax=Holothuria leucospilota TaxID=206669 RepID=A0A9Q1BBG6_HOLLE|nr:hypothetical protein HOLleu_40156 [Holothuria leucospilota]